MAQNSKPTYRYLKDAQSQSHGHSRAVIVQGGTTVYVSGQAVLKDSTGKSLVGDVEGQTREIFADFERILKEAGGSLANLVSMTVFASDAKYGEPFWKIRCESFREDYPSSAFIVVKGFAHPDILVEVQGIAVI